MTPDDLTRTSPPDATRDQSDAALDAGLAAAFGGDTTHARPPSADPEAGAVIAGKYRLGERIGEGGMGSVWAATQTEPVKRKVAVKLIKAGMDSKAVLARFDAERQALAVMDHPNIAKVLDGGLHDGRPYFVMELVKGVPITQFCDERKLTPQQRLELFVPVCQAIQHAHQKGVIHRDIKPSNVLVALYDDKPVPKVIDFGIAKATGAALTEHTLDTGIGAVVGTPAYMSPEQASLNNLDIDTRSDVYALGVLLYELLTGSPPFSKKELEKKGLLEILRVVREDEPPRPSTKLSTADALPTLSANRGTEPKKLTGLLRNELDWIVMKALEKDRTRRYETANGFAADVLRYLNGEAVIAHPPSATYRLKKFVRKHRVQVIAGAIVLVVLVVGVVSTTLALLHAEQRRSEAEASREKLLDVLDSMTGSELGDTLAAQPQLLPEQRQFLEKSLGYYEDAMRAGGGGFNSKTRTALAANRVGKIRAALGQYEQAADALRRSCTLWEEVQAANPSDCNVLGQLALAEKNLGVVLLELDQWKEAAGALVLARDHLKTLLALNPADPTYQWLLLSTQYHLSQGYERLGRTADALLEVEAAIEVMRPLATKSPADPVDQLNFAKLLQRQGVAREKLRRGDALDSHRGALELLRAIAGPTAGTPEYRHALGSVLFTMARSPTVTFDEQRNLYAEAVSLLRPLTREFPSRPSLRLELATYLFHHGLAATVAEQLPEAEAAFREVIALDENLVIENRRDLLTQRQLGNSCGMLGNVLTLSGRTDDALRWLDRAVEQLEPLWRQDPAYATTKHNLRDAYGLRAVNRLAAKRYADSVADWDHAIAFCDAVPPGTVDWNAVDLRAVRARSLAWVKPDAAVAEVQSLLANELKPTSGVVGNVPDGTTMLFWLRQKHSREELHSYWFACVYATAARKSAENHDAHTARAMALLQHAVAAGWKDHAHIQKDTDLDPLRERDDFKKLLAELEAKFPPKKEELPPPRADK